MKTEIWEILVGCDQSENLSNYCHGLNFRSFKVGQVGELSPDVALVICYIHGAHGEDLYSIAQLKERYAGVPFLCVVPEAGHFLGVWALRARMWDVLELPREFNRLVEDVKSLVAMTQQFKPVVRRMIVPGLAQRQGGEAVVDSPTRRAIAFVAENFDRKIHVDNVAQLCGMSSVQFARLFKKEHGCTFRDYVKSVRLGHAQHALAYSDAQIQDIAFNCGYEEISAFNRIFKAEVGLTPTEYRESVIAQRVKKSLRSP